MPFHDLRNSVLRFYDDRLLVSSPGVGVDKPLMRLDLEQITLADVEVELPKETVSTRDHPNRLPALHAEDELVEVRLKFKVPSRSVIKFAR